LVLWSSNNGIIVLLNVVKVVLESKNFCFSRKFLEYSMRYFILSATASILLISTFLIIQYFWMRYFKQHIIDKGTNLVVFRR